MKRTASDVLLKRTMTKKAYEASVRKNRSVVSLGKNLGTRTMGSAKDKKATDRAVAKMLRREAWD